MVVLKSLGPNLLHNAEETVVALNIALGQIM